MAIGDIIVGLDIGTSKVSAIVGEVNNFSQIEIISSAKYKCRGVQKGKIVDEDEISLSIAKAIQDAEDKANLKIHSAYVTVPGKYITIVQNSIIKEVKDKYAGISVKDVSTSIMQIKDIEIPEGKAIIDIVTESFILDNGEEVQDPVGCLSSNFTIQAQIILVDKEYMKKMNSILKKAGVELDGMVPITLAERNLVLDRNELNDNIMLLDIGAGNIDIGVFEGNKFVYTNTIPLGGDTIRKDIELVLGISEEEADKLKRQYGLALKSFIDNDHDIYLSTCAEDSNKTIKSSELIEIIEARIEEMFSLINKDIVNQGIKQRINNVILTGQGITNINKSDVAGKIALNIPVKISTGRLVSTIKPSYRTAYALIRYVSSKPFSKSVASTTDATKDENIFKTLIEKIKEFFYS
ncbi:MAG: cell division protein FtsA [Clostridia bacterium]|nr:cell division protein FtsA [Clostridia bacterium]MCI9275126.1 cell division protein FtsA [Clostridia bacterium]